MQTPTSRVTLEIDLQAVRRNFRRIREKVAPLKVMAVLKANAYGLGASTIAAALKDEGIDAFGVAEPKEAMAIADLGVPTLVLGGLLPDEIQGLIQQNAWIPIQTESTARLVSETAGKLGKTAHCHLLIDTGMGRLGLERSQAVETITRIHNLPHLAIKGIYSHFPTAYTDRPFSESQIALILGIVDRLKSEQGITFEHIHISNSDGLHNVPAATRPPFTMVRTGINLYGCFDLEGRRELKLEEVIRIKSRLVSIRELPAGATVGYGRTCMLPKPTPVGTVSIGYADGLPLYFSNKGHLKIRGIDCPIIGRTSMDYTTVDLSAVPNATVGDEVVCLGDGITTADWARAKGTIPYEVICSIGNRVERVVV